MVAVLFLWFRRHAIEALIETKLRAGATGRRADLIRFGLRFVTDQPVAARWFERIGEWARSEEHTSELQSRPHLVCRLLLEKKKVYRSGDAGCFSLADGIAQPAHLNGAQKPLGALCAKSLNVGGLVVAFCNQTAMNIVA